MAGVIKPAANADPSADSAVLRLTDFVAEARGAVLEARKEAARIVTEARAKAEQTERAAAERGYQEGFARGRHDGYADGQRAGSQQGMEQSAGAAAQALSCAQRIAEELAAAKAELLDQARRELLEFALQVARRIVGAVAARDVTVAQTNLDRVLEMAGVAKAVTVQVNPGQLQALRERCRQSVEELALKGRVQLVGDARLSPGGARLLTGSGQIDATIETQLANVVQALVGEDPSTTPPGRYEPQELNETHPARPPACEDSAAADDHERV